METVIDGRTLVDQQFSPAFIVQDNCIVYTNAEAALLELTSGTQITNLLAGNASAYQEFEDGRLYMAMQIGGKSVWVTISRYTDFDLFIVDDSSRIRLQALALAAKELRGTFSEVYLVMERMHRSPSVPMDDTMAAGLRSSLRMHRLISNMADAAEYQNGIILRQCNVNLTHTFREVFERTKVYMNGEGPRICYHLPSESVYGAANPEMLQRAAYNLLSNAIKFSPKNGTVEAWVIKTDTHLQLIVQDEGSGVPPHIQSSFFSRYHRPPAIEEGRQGIGIGMQLVRSIATLHGGTVLLQQTPGKGARVCFTVSLRQPSAGLLLSPLHITSHFSGEQQALLELSDVLPLSAFQ